ncbi:MAG: DUF2062 domain-containing protein [Gammaproteobacteria bacterium]
MSAKDCRPTATPPSLWQRRVVAPVVAQLRQGITPEKIALTLALGGVLGIFPILGTTMLLCAVVGVWLRLNQPIIQLVNYLVYPAQIVLLIPFYRAGERLFGAEPVPIVDVPGLIARFGQSPWQFILDYGMVGLYGIVVWCLVAPVLTALAYALLKPTLVATARGLKSSAAAAPPPDGG